ncbi:MAG: DUF3592 domain-containing protein [Myxococcota bacterium]
MRRVLLFVAIAALGLVVASSGNRVSPGTVVGVDVRDGQCAKGNVDCTRFDARVEYVAEGRVERAIDHDWAYGYGVPAAEGRLQPGDRAWVAYHPATPSMGMVLSLRSLGLLAVVAAIPVFWGVVVLAGRSGRRSS